MDALGYMYTPATAAAAATASAAKGAEEGPSTGLFGILTCQQ